MLLAIDIGNSTIRIGVARDGSLVTTRRAATAPAGTSDEMELVLEGLLGLDGQDLAGVRSIVVCSTVPAQVAAVEAMAARRMIPCVAATAGVLPLPVRVERPAEVGPDRLVNAYAAVHLYGSPAVVVDCGTAPTLDAVDRDGAFVGGAIAPGVGLGLDALAARTARLPRVEPQLPGSAIGRDTTSAIQVGTVLGHRAMIEGLLARMRRELAAGPGVAPHDVRVVLTGGMATLPWARSIDGVDALDPNLTLRGLVLFHRAVTGSDEA